MKLDTLRNGKYFGIAQLSAYPNMQAEFVLDGRHTVVTLHAAAPLDREIRDRTWLPIVLPDGTKLTFVQNVLIGQSKHQTREGRRYTGQYNPHFVIVGDRHVDEGMKFACIGLRVADAPTIFYDFDAFSIALNPDVHMQTLLASQEDVIKRKIRRGNEPILAYFTGKSEIFSVSTSLGRISAHHMPSYSINSPQGVSIENRIVITIEPITPVSLHQAIDLTMPLMRFLMIVAGRRQEILEFSVEPSDAAGRQGLEVYWCREPVTPPFNSDSPSPADIPINGGIEPQLFGQVMTAWLATDNIRRDGRQRFSTGFARSNVYDEDRMVGAANMFDILPVSSEHQSIELSEELAAARDTALKLFKSLPNSLERATVLGTLGRLGRPSLKQKVRHRAQILQSTASERFPELELVVDEAVNCRNHFVHGGATDPALSDSFRHQTPFLADSLEFVFAASEFIEAGWSLTEWASRGTSMTHPWGAYLINYRDRLPLLKAHVELRKAVEKAARKA